MRYLSAALLAIAITVTAQARPPGPASNAPLAAAPASNWNGAWIGSWAAAQMVPEQDNAVPLDSLHNAALRQIVHLSVGGAAIRVRISNAFGTAPLHLIAVHVARSVSPASSRIELSSDRGLTFNERTAVLIPPGAEYTSDPLTYAVAPLSDLAITMQIEAAPEQETGHPGSRATSYLGEGVSISAPEFSGAQAIEHWHLHPSPAGYRAMAEAIALELLQK